MQRCGSKVEATSSLEHVDAEKRGRGERETLSLASGVAYIATRAKRRAREFDLH